MLQSELLSTTKDSESKRTTPPFRFKKAQSSSTVPVRRHKDLQGKTATINRRRCQSLSPSQMEKNCHAVQQQRTSPTQSSNNMKQEPENDIAQRMKSKTLRLFAVRKREYIKSRKNLMMQQDSFLEQYAALKELEKRSGLVDEILGDIRLVSLKGWPAHDLLVLIRDDLEMPMNCEIGPHVIEQIKAQLYSIPEEVNAMGVELTTSRLDILNLFRSRHRNDRGTYQMNLEWKNKNTEIDEETNRLSNVVAGMTENLKAKINAIYELVKLAWKDRDTMIKKIDVLEKENSKLHCKLQEDLKRDIEDSQTSKDGLENIANFEQNMSEEIKKERAAKNSLKEVVSCAEGMLRVARTKITTLERQLKETKADLDVTRRKHKDLENLYRHRESNYDAHAKKLIEVSKTGEMTIDALSRQRDALELRVKELRDQAEEAERAAAVREAEVKSRTESLMAKVAKQENIQKVGVEKTIQYENYIKNLEEQLATLRERSLLLTELEKQHCLDFIPSKENEPSNRETEIWKVLQVTRLALSRAEEELRQSRADKESFLDSLARIAQDEGANKEANLGAELINREKKINQLQQIIKEHQENEKMMEQSVTDYENQLAELKLEVKVLRNYDCYAKEIPHQDLQTELLVMNTQVETLTRERKALVNAAASRALMLERHERAADLFVRITRARRELEAQLEGQNELSAEGIPDNAEISQSLSSICADAENAWTALKAERTRVLHLESAVLSQSLQLEREERVRTQLERRKALLERELLRVKHTASASKCKNMSFN